MSDGIKRKVVIPINLYETTNSNRLKTGGTVTASIYVGGVQIEASATIPASPSTTNVTCSGRGSLPTTGTLAVVRQSGGVWNRIDTGGEVIVVSGIEENSASPGEFLFTLTDTSGLTLNVLAGDRLVMLPSAYATLYEDESENTDSLTNPIDVPNSGVIEFYVDASSVDVYLSGADITDGYYAFNVSSAGVGLGPFRLVPETANADGSNILNVDATTGVVYITDDTNAVQTIEHATRERFLVVYPSAGAVQLSTLATKADNTIYEATPRTITLTQDVPVLLHGVEGASADICYWVIVGTPNLVDFGLDDLNDVSASSPTTGRPLVWNGSAWVDSTSIGTSGAPLATMYVVDTGLFLNNGTFNAVLDAAALTASRTFTFPDQAGELVVTGGVQAVSGRKTFDDGILTGFRIESTTGTDRVASFDASAITDSTNRNFGFPDKSGTFAMTSDLKNNLSDLSDTNISSPLEGQPLVYNSSAEWANLGVGSTIGTSSNPIFGIWVGTNQSTGSLRWLSFGSEGVLAVDVITSDRNWELPDQSGTLLVDSGTVHTVTRSFWFDDSAATGLFDQLVNHKNASFLMFTHDPGQTNGITLLRVDYEWNLSANSTAATPTELNLYSFSTYTPGTTVPPTGGTALLSSNIPVPSTGTSGSVGNITSFVSSGLVSASRYIALGIAVNNSEPAVAGELIISISYSLRVDS